MKSILSIITASILLVACSRPSSDAVIRRQIVGTWTPTPSNSLTIHPDGSLKIVHTGATLEGTWAVDHGVLTQTITNISGTHLGVKVGQVSRYEVVRVDEQELSCRIPGQTALFTAKKQ